jgi:hypothetical protein
LRPGPVKSDSSAESPINYPRNCARDPVVGQVRGAPALDGRRLRAQKAEVSQVVDAGLGILGGVGQVERARDLLVPAGVDLLGEGRVDLRRLAGEPTLTVRIGERGDPAVRRRIVAGMADNDGRLVYGGIVGARRGGQVGRRELDDLAAHRAVPAGPEDLDRVGHGGENAPPWPVAAV